MFYKISVMFLLKKLIASMRFKLMVSGDCMKSSTCHFAVAHLLLLSTSMSIMAGSPLSPSRQKPQTGPFAIPRIHP